MLITNTLDKKSIRGL